MPYFADYVGQRIARGEDGKTYTIPGDITYNDWYKRYVRGERDDYDIYVEDFEEIIKLSYEEQQEIARRYAKSERLNKKINKGHQDKHFKGTRNYEREKARGVYKSYLTIPRGYEAELVKQYAGTGRMIINKTNKYNLKEIVAHSDYVGYDVKKDKNKPNKLIETKTKNFIIHYSKDNGVHIMPTLGDVEK